MRRAQLWSRRRVLTGVGALGVPALAGCVGGGGSSSEKPPRDSVFESIAFEGQYLVVRLRGDHDVSGVNVIGPDGSLFAQQGVAVGETRVAIEMLDPRSGISDHYASGVHEVIAITGDAQESMEVDLAPEILITDVSQYTDGDSARELAGLLVTVENTGTAPAWITDFAVRDAPNWATNEDLNAGSGIPSFNLPETPAEALIEAGDRQTYVPNELPFLFDGDDQNCNRDIEVTLLAGVSDGSLIEADLTVLYSGSLQTDWLGNKLCSDLKVSITRQQSSREKFRSGESR